MAELSAMDNSYGTNIDWFFCLQKTARNIAAETLGYLDEGEGLSQ